MAIRVPGRLAAKVNSFPESSYGATRVALILADGRVIDDVILSGPDIVRLQGVDVSCEHDLGFSVIDIVDAVPRDKHMSRLRLFLHALFRSRG